MRIGFVPVGVGAKINIPGWKKAWEGLIRDEAQEVWEYFEQSLSGFHNHRPLIQQKFSATVNAKGDVEVIVGILRSTPDNRVYSHVNWGTSARVIRIAAGGRPMIFKTKYFPATSRGTLSGGQWSKVGPWTVAFFINHPGTQGRRFDEFIQTAMEGSISHAARNMISKRRGKTWSK